MPGPLQAPPSVVSRILSFILELTLWQNARVTPHECLAVELHFPEVEPLEKIATRADLAGVTPVPCAHVGIRDGVASSEELGCPGRRPSAL